MPGARDESQTVMTVSMPKLLLSLVERGRAKLSGINRAQFVRDALSEKLKSMGLSVPEDAVKVPDRVKQRHRDAIRLNVSLNESPTPPPVKERRADVKYEKPKRKRKP